MYLATFANCVYIFGRNQQTEHLISVTDICKCQKHRQSVEWSWIFKNNIALLGLSYWRVMALLQKQPFLPMVGHLPNENGTASDCNSSSVILFKDVDRPFYFSFKNS